MHEAQLHVGTFTRSLLIDLARSTGRFAAAGLEVRETSVTSSPAQFTSLEAGEFDLVLTSPDNVIAYRFLAANPLGRNLPITIAAAIDRGLGLSLCLGPSVEDIESLRRGVVGVDVPQSGFAFVAFALLDRAGLAPGDYVVESMGSTPRRAQNLIDGTCAATVLNAGNELRAEGAGCAIIGRVGDLGPYLGTVIAGMETADPQRVAIRDRFADALLGTSGEILTGRLEAEVIEAAMRLLALSEDEARAHRDCLLDPQRGLIGDGRVDAASVDTLLGLRRSYRPSPELDSVTRTWRAMVLDRALEEPSAHA